MKNNGRRLKRVSKIEQFSYWSNFYYVAVKTRELTPKQIRSVACNTCGAAIGERCELHTGALRTEPHRERKLAAAEVASTNPPNNKWN
jgi:hypothetical protein